MNQLSFNIPQSLREDFEKTLNDSKILSLIKDQTIIPCYLEAKSIHSIIKLNVKDLQFIPKKALLLIVFILETNPFYKNYQFIQIEGFIQIKYDFFNNLNFEFKLNQYIINDSSMTKIINYEELYFWK